MKEIICIVCPKGCRLHVDEQKEYQVTGFGCLRGEAYGKAEATNPTRVLTTTVRAAGGVHPRLPVKTDAPIPKPRLFEAMRILDSVEVTAPVEQGQIIVKNILNTGANVVATRSL